VLTRLKKQAALTTLNTLHLGLRYTLSPLHDILQFSCNFSQ